MSMKVQIARAIAAQTGYDYDRVFENKQEWVAEHGLRGGRFHDVNEPYRADFDAAADAVLDALMEPTEGMLMAAADIDGMDMRLEWRAMIQAAKEERDEAGRGSQWL